REHPRHAAALPFGQWVTVEVAARDRYARLLAEMRLPDGRSLNQELVPRRLRVVVPALFVRPSAHPTRSGCPPRPPRSLGRSPSHAAVGVPTRARLARAIPVGSRSGVTP